MKCIHCGGKLIEDTWFKNLFMAIIARDGQIGIDCRYVCTVCARPSKIVGQYCDSCKERIECLIKGL